MIRTEKDIADDKALKLREKLGTMHAAVVDMDRWILEGAFRGGFSVDRINDFYHRISIIQNAMVELER